MRQAKWQAKLVSRQAGKQAVDVRIGVTRPECRIARLVESTLIGHVVWWACSQLAEVLNSVVDVGIPCSNSVDISTKPTQRIVDLSKALVEGIEC